MHNLTATVSLRIGTHLWESPARLDEVLTLVKDFSQTVTEVACFTGFTHPPLPLATIARRAETLAAILPRFRALGVAAGINHLSTLGHLDENLANSLREPWQHLVDISGTESRSCYCPSDPAMQDYIGQSYAALAAAKPAFIWVDDDVRLEHHPPGVTFACFCPRCLARFAEETGTAWTREVLAAAFDGGAREERLALRRRWLAHNRGVIGDLLALIRAAVDAVDPAIPLGLMTADVPYSGLDFPNWAAALAGENGLAVKWRPGGGFYTDAMPTEALVKAHAIGRQTGLLPHTMTDVQYEHENFPYQRLKKSVRLFTAEIAAAIGAGCTGVALNILSAVPTPLIEEYRPLFAAVDARKDWYDAAVGAFGRSACEGVWTACTRDHFAAMQADGAWGRGPLWGGGLWSANELSEIGLPLAYTADGARVALVSGDAVLDFSRDRWRELLAGGVLLDGPALARLHELGLGEYAGFAPAGEQLADTIEQLADDPLNGRFAGWQRDCRPSFYPTMTYFLQPTAPGARPLAHAVDFTPTDLGIVAGAYENRLGGRVAVLGYYPWHALGTLMKTAQMKALARWLSGDTLPAYVDSYTKTALWCRRDAEGNPALLVLNASLDDADDLRLCLRDKPEVLVVADRHNLGESLIPKSADDGPYGIYHLPPLGAWEAVVVTVM
jgi:hypothetical protein